MATKTNKRRGAMLPMLPVLPRHRAFAASALLALLFAAAPAAHGQDRFNAGISDQTLYVGSSFSITLPPFQTGKLNLSYSIVEALPEGLSFSPSDRVLSGTPAATSTRTAYTYRAYIGETYQ